MRNKLTIFNYKKKFSFLLLLFINLIHKFFSITCSDRNYPIHQSGNCISQICLNTDLKNGICEISNPIIKTQYLTNIIKVGEINNRYLSYAINENGDFIFETTVYPKNGIRTFFGLTKNGRFFFENENPFYSINITNKGESYQTKYESTSHFIKVSNNLNEKEYFLSIANYEGNCEIYDFDNNNIYAITSNDFYANAISSNIGSIFKLKNDTSKNYYIMSMIVSYKYKDYFEIIKYYFNSIDIENNGYVKENNIIRIYSSNRKAATCFETDSGNIMCLYQNTNYEFIIVVYSNDLIEITTEIMDIESDANTNDCTIFFKTIYFKENTGIFSYYDSINNVNPIIKFYKYNTIDSSIEKINPYEIILNKYSFSYELMMNDIIKINNEKICFSAHEFNDKNILYFIIINLFDNDNKYIIRYYSINLYNLYYMSLHCEMKMMYYNQYIGFSLSSNVTNQNDLTTEIYSSLMFFSYPNSTDITFDIINHLNQTNDSLNEMNFNFSSEYYNIENNLFGYIIKGIKIINYSKNIEVKQNNIIISEGKILENNFEIQISILDNILYENSKQNITYCLVLTEPDLDIYNEYPIYINKTYGEPNFEKEEYIGRSSYINFIVNKNVTNNCNNSDCNLCFNDDINNCIECKNNFIYENGKKICLQEKKMINITNFEEIYNKLKNEIENGTKFNINEIIYTEIADYQITTLNNQKNNTNINFPTIDFHECKDILLKQEKLNITDDFILFLINIKNKNSTIKNYIHYELYNPKTLKKVNLTACKNTKISINISTILNKNFENLYLDLESYGYNLLDINDSFYNDICTPYTSPNSTDVLISDRQKDIYNIVINNSVCQNNCEMNSYDKNIKRMECLCDIEENLVIDYNNIGTSNIIIKSFYTSIKNSNFEVMKCYKYLFSNKGIKNNIGCILIIVFLFIFICFNIIYCIKGKNSLKNFLVNIYENKLNNIEKKSKNEKNTKLKNSKTFTKSAKKKNFKKSEPPKKNAKSSKTTILNVFNNINQKRNNDNNLLFNNNSNNIFINKENRKKTFNIFRNLKKNTNNINHDKINHSKNNNKNKNNISEFNNEKSESIAIRSKKKNNNSHKIKENNIDFNKLTNQEKNSLSYSESLKLDKRSFIQFYNSIIKQKHLIAFSFIPNNDYNIYILKLAMFQLIFLSLLTVNGFFFSDSTMHKIYVNGGQLTLLHRIPILIYSSLISVILKSLIKKLGSSDREILNIKKNINKQKSKEKINDEIKCLKNKFIIFFVFGYILILFFWYYISCFCAIFHNTQLKLIEDTLISFYLSMSYPFLIYLLPAILRMTALKSKEKDKDLLFKVSQFIYNFL